MVEIKKPDVNGETDSNENWNGMTSQIKLTDDSPKRKPRFHMDGPDGGWAWCVALAACSITFIIAGLARMSGIMYVAYIDAFHVSRQEAAYPSAIRASTKNLLGPVVGIIGQQYGVRAVTLAGGVIASISAAACYFAWNMDFIVVVWGGLNGIGCALTVTLLQVVIGHHFKKHHSTAAGLSFSGGCVGSFVFPVLIEYLLHQYGLQGTFLIISAITMHIVPAAMILRKPVWMKDQKVKMKPEQSYLESVRRSDDSIPNEFKTGECEKHIEANDLESNKTSVKNADEQMTEIQLGQNDILFYWYLNDKILVIETIMRIIQSASRDEAQIADDIKHLFNANSDSSNGTLPSWAIEVADDIYKNAAEERNVDFSAIAGNNCSNYDITASESLKCKLKNCLLSVIAKPISNAEVDLILEELKTKRQLSEIHAKEVLSEIISVCKLYPKDILNPNSVAIVIDKDGVCKPVGNEIPKPTIQKKLQLPLIKKDGFKEHLKTAVKLNYNPFFLLVCLCRVVHFVTFVPFVTVLVDYGIDKGLPEDDGKYIIAALSAGDLIGRVGLGWVTDRNCLSLPKFMLFVTVTQGALTATLPLVQSRLVLMITVALFGMFVGAAFIRHPVLISKYMDQKEQSIAMGCINFVPGVIGFGLPPFIGYFRDTLGSYDRMFFITGSIGITIGLLWLLEPQLAKCAPPRRDDLDEHGDTKTVEAE